MPIFTLNVPAGAGVGSGLDTLHLIPRKSVQVAGTFDATVQIEGSNDNQEWEALADAVTSHAILQISTPIAWMRVNITVYGSGTPRVTLCGLRPT